MKKPCSLMLFLMPLMLAACAGTAEPPAENTVLRLGMMASLDALPFVLINQNGLAETYGFTLLTEPFSSAKERDAALQAGELDGVLTDYIGVCIYQNAGLDVKITGITDGDYLLLAGKNTDAHTLEDICGRSTAVSENTLIDYALFYILSKNNLQADAVRRELIPRIPDRLELLRSGKVELALLPEPFASLALADGAVSLGSANQCGLYPAVSAFTQTALEQKGDAIKLLYTAYDEAVDYMNRTPVTAYEREVIAAVGYPAALEGKITLKPFRKNALPPQSELESAVAWAASKGLCLPSLTYEQLTFAFAG